MRQATILSSFFLFMIMLFAASCGSNRSFSSRKYTAGNYVSHQHKPGKVSTQEQPEQEAALVAKDEGPAGKIRVAEKTDAVSTDEIVAADKTALGMTSTKSTSSSSTLSKEKKADVKEKDIKIRAFKAESLKKHIADRTIRKAVAADEDGNSLDAVALVSFILGILGLVLNILAISVVVATAEYVFALLFIAGMVLGIIAVVFGTQGLRRYHKTKNGTINLVFSIVGTAFGAGAIITAFVFAFYTLILAISGI